MTQWPCNQDRRLFLLALAAVVQGCGSGSGSGTEAAAPSAPLPAAPGPVPPSSVPAPVLAPPAPATFPVSVQAGKRYLVDAAGKPFFLNGDSPWDLMVSLTREQVDQYLEDRRLKGINAVLVELMEHYFSGHAPNNAYGVGPFTTPGDFSTPNEAYFAQVDYVIAKAAEKGILVLLAPAYVGYNGLQEGWYQEMAANGTAKLQAFGQYVGNRYKNAGNIVWVDGGDYNVADKELVRAVANGIRSVDTKPHTYHAKRGTAAMQFWGTTEPWLTLNSIYTDETTVVSAAFGEYARSTAPYFLIEARYEGTIANTLNEQGVRAQAYQAALSGATGHVMGRDKLWDFQAGWQQLLNSGGAKSLLPLATLFAARSWWTLLPDVDNTVLTAGAGTGADRAVAARAANGSFVLAYLPSNRSIGIDLSRLAGPKVKAQWFDPATGASTDVPGSPFAAQGTQSFKPAGNNGSGYGDWVLVLDSTA